MDEWSFLNQLADDMEELKTPMTAQERRELQNVLNDVARLTGDDVNAAMSAKVEPEVRKIAEMLKMGHSEWDEWFLRR